MVKRPVVKVVGIWGKREDVEVHKEDMCHIAWADQ